MAKKPPPPISAASDIFNRRIIDTTVILVALGSLAASLILFFLVIRPANAEAERIATEQQDYEVSTADIRAQLLSTLSGDPDSVAQRMKQVDKLKERMARYNTDITPSTTLDLPLSPDNTMSVTLLDATGTSSPSGAVRPSDYYARTSGDTMYVRYAVTVNSNSLSDLRQFVRSVNRSQVLMQMVNPSITFSPAAAGLDADGTTKPWSLSGELWVWGVAADD